MVRKKKTSLPSRLLRSPYTLLGLSAYLALALFLADQQGSEVLGWLGGFVSSTLKQYFGVSAWVIPLGVAYVALQKIRKLSISSKDQSRLAGLLFISATLVGYSKHGGAVGNLLWGLTEAMLGQFFALAFLATLFGLCISPNAMYIAFVWCKRPLNSIFSLPVIGDRDTNGSSGKSAEQESTLSETESETSLQPGKARVSGTSNRKNSRPSPPSEGGPERNYEELGNGTSPTKQYGNQRPNLDLLEEPFQEAISDEELQESSSRLAAALRQFQIKADVAETVAGSVVATHFVEPKRGTKISEIERHLPDISRFLGYPDDAVRVNLDIFGKKGKVAIELPVNTRRNVGLRGLLESTEPSSRLMQLPLRLGINTLGETVCVDLADMPHLLVAGSTGSGKSIALNSLIVSLLYHSSPEQLQLLLIDPKMVEFSQFKTLPHLRGEVITESDDAVSSLMELTELMDNRYRIFNENNSRNILEFNETSSELEKLPNIVVVIDELADLLMQEGVAIEEPLVRLAQKARAAGIHLIVATQRPTADIITGLIKANVPARLAFRVNSRVDSHVILNQKGAESLQGKGDGLFLNPTVKGLVRLQSPMVSLDEIERVVNFWNTI